MIRRVFLLAVIVSCGARTPTKSVPDDASIDDAASTPMPRPDASPRPPGSMTNAVVLDDCGPADGPAFKLRISTVPLLCSLSANQNTTRDEITLYDDLPTSAPATVIVMSGNGDARSCTGSTCVEAVVARIQFTSITVAEAHGTYQMTLRGGATKSGSFVAAVCHNGVMCG